ncbi:cache domain protein, partial [Vibrio harveyi]
GLPTITEMWYPTQITRLF